MRKITKEIVTAFIEGKKRKISNTATDRMAIYLHGNKIAWKSRKGRNIGYYISSAGYKTLTTKERLNGLLEILNKPKIYQKNYIWYRETGEKFYDGMEA